MSDYRINTFQIPNTNKSVLTSSTLKYVLIGFILLVVVIIFLLYNYTSIFKDTHVEKFVNYIKSFFKMNS